MTSLVGHFGWDASRRRVRLPLRAWLALAAALLLVVILVWPSSNLLLGRPWKTSSKLADCDPARGVCVVPNTRIFFHTNVEANPFIEFDLGRSVLVSRLRVENRRDGNVQNRAVPLVALLSEDGSSWTEVARKGYWFQIWSVRFHPRPARYLRLTVPKVTWLHLEKVELR